MASNRTDSFKHSITLSWGLWLAIAAAVLKHAASTVDAVGLHCNPIA